MEAKLVNAVLTIQRFARGFITRKRFEKILEELYLKETQNILEKEEKNIEVQAQPEYEYIDFPEMSNEAILDALKNKFKATNTNLPSNIPQSSNQKKGDGMRPLSRDMKQKKETMEKNPENNGSKIQRDPNWDATITSKSKSKHINELMAQMAQSQTGNNASNLKNSTSNLKESKILITNSKIPKKLVESQELKLENLKNSKVLSTSSNQSKKDDMDSNKSSLKASDKISMNNTTKLFNTNANMNQTKGKGTINSKNDISAISYQYGVF